ncbi:MAG: NAD(P)H-dependent glycerol-3-phosphate dehydrogenase [Thermodesulfobacteriota bacterium]
MSLGDEIKVGVIGAGSWGTTLANLLAEEISRVELWVFEGELYRILREKRENTYFLPGLSLSPNISFTQSIAQAFADKDFLVCALPSHAVRTVFREGSPFLQEKTLLVSATKGLEEETCKTASQIIREEVDPAKKVSIACLSGPSFAREVSRKIPTAVTAAAYESEVASRVQTLFARPYFRVYTNDDLPGVELAGAVKNVMAIAAGICDGLGLGHSSRAALITRGLAEMTRLGVRMGAKEKTFFGLAGLGDLVLTCTGDLSRNRQVGLEIGRGRPLKEILGGMKMVAEGIKTTKALRHLAQNLNIEMPITEKIYEIIYEGKKPHQAVGELMNRLPRSE